MQELQIPVATVPYMAPFTTTSMAIARRMLVKQAYQVYRSTAVAGAMFIPMPQVTILSKCQAEAIP